VFFYRLRVGFFSVPAKSTAVSQKVAIVKWRREPRDSSTTKLIVVEPLAPPLAVRSADGWPTVTGRGQSGSNEKMSEPGAGKRTSGGSCAVRSGEAGGDCGCSHLLRQRRERDGERRAEKKSERGSGGGNRRKAKRKRRDEGSAPGPTTGTASAGAVHQPKGGGGRKKKRKRSRSGGRIASPTASASAAGGGAAPEAAAGPRRAPTGTCALGVIREGEASRANRRRRGKHVSSKPDPGALPFSPGSVKKHEMRERRPPKKGGREAGVTSA
jgi:hypothetical protein